MFCSDVCVTRHSSYKNHISAGGIPYRSSVARATAAGSVYKQLAHKDSFCVSCGNATHRTRETSSLAAGFLILAALVPTSIIAITSKCQRAVITSVYE